MTRTRLLLFDIDGTLVLTGGAGARAMDRAFADLFGIADAFVDVSMAGRTDRWLIEQALAAHGLAATPERLDAFRTRYLALLDETVSESGSGRRGIMPGVNALLDVLQERSDTHLALLTGNYAAGARIKLSHFGLWNRFGWGAFGDDHVERDELAIAALADASERGVPLARPSQAVVIGDTPFDIACARAAGARVVAVATGGFSVDELRAHDPDVAVEDLTDAQAIIDAIDG